MTGARDAPLVPLSWGELLDKITILEIKAARITDPASRANVARELGLLQDIARPVLPEAGLAPLLERLRAVNRALWVIEDDIRLKEARGEFDAGFIRLARSVYRTNDERSAVKRQINLLLGSALVEEKCHPTGRAGGGP